MTTKGKSKTKARPRQAKPTVADAVWDNVKQLLIAIVLAVIIKTSIVEAYKIPSASMEDTLLIGDFLAANKFIYGARLPLVGYRLPAIRDPEQGDVVIFKWPVDRQTNYIKRCVATPGQTVEIKDKVLFVDGIRFPDPEFSKYEHPGIKRRPDSGKDTPDNFGPYTLGRDYYFMMGDNRDNSLDSRFWGPVHRDLILGEAMIVHWSWAPDDSSPDARLSEPLSVPRMFVYNIIHFFERVRWSRLARIIR
jgi:signal peptidase I